MKKNGKQSISEIARAHGVYPSTIWRIVYENRKTARIDIAIAVGRLTKKRPIEYMNAKNHRYLLASYPALGRRKPI